MKQGTHLPVIAVGLFVGTIVLQPMNGFAAEADEMQTEAQQTAVRQREQEHLPDLIEQSRAAQRTYVHIQENGTNQQADQARLERNAADRAVAEELARRSGYSADQLQQMHDGGMDWGYIADEMNGSGSSSSGRGVPMGRESTRGYGGGGTGSGGGMAGSGGGMAGSGGGMTGSGGGMTGSGRGMTDRGDSPGGGSGSGGGHGSGSGRGGSGGSSGGHGGGGGRGGGMR